MNLDANDIESLLRPLRLAAQETRGAISPTQGVMSTTRDAPPTAPEALSSSRAAPPLEAALSLTRAERELERVLRDDHARWLARAALLRASRRPLAVHFGIVRLGRGALRVLRAHWIELAATTRACGLSLPRVLRACASDDVDEWPSAVQMARAAVELEPSSETRRVLGVCLRAEGWIDLAHEIEADLDRARRVPVDRSHVSRAHRVLDMPARRAVDGEDVDCGGCI